MTLNKQGFWGLLASGVLLFLTGLEFTLASGELHCGLKPLPEIGCHIGRCVDGEWEQVCDTSPSLVCGLKPLPEIGCRIGRCVDGQWEQVCD